MSIDIDFGLPVIPMGDIPQVSKTSKPRLKANAEYCFSASKNGRSRIECFRNRTLALARRSQLSGQGYRVSSMEVRQRR